MATQIRIQDAGLHGTLRLRLITDSLAHVLRHSETDETSGTWTGLACPDHGPPIGSDVDTDMLQRMCAGTEIADLLWEVPPELTRPHNAAFHDAMQALRTGRTTLAEQHWNDLTAVWSQAWAANYDVLQFMQETGLDRLASGSAQRWLIASFEHHTSPHGIKHPHIHNIVIAAR
jgi:hypothetical protein